MLPLFFFIKFLFCVKIPYIIKIRELSMYSIPYNQLNVFFANIGKSVSLENEFDEKNVDNQVLWKALQICDYSANLHFENNTQEEKILNEKFFIDSLSIDNLSNLESSSQPLIAEYAKEFKDKYMTDPMISYILLHIQSELRKVKFSPKETNKKFSKYHLLKILKYTFFAGILTFTYYSYQNMGFIGLAAILAFGGYWGVKKGLISFSKKRMENQVVSKIKSNLNNKVSLPNGNNIGEWGNLSFLNANLLEEFTKLQKQMIIFSQVYSQKKSIDNLNMENDLIKMNDEHIPLLLSHIKDKLYKEDVVINTLNIMNQLLQDHLSELLWKNERELNATHRYWLNKVANSGRLDKLLDIKSA